MANSVLNHDLKILDNIGTGKLYLAVMRILMYLLS